MLIFPRASCARNEQMSASTTSILTASNVGAAHKGIVRCSYSPASAGVIKRPFFRKGIPLGKGEDFDTKNRKNTLIETPCFLRAKRLFEASVGPQIHLCIERSRRGRRRLCDCPVFSARKIPTGSAAQKNSCDYWNLMVKHFRLPV